MLLPVSNMDILQMGLKRVPRTGPSVGLSIMQRAVPLPDTIREWQRRLEDVAVRTFLKKASLDPNDLSNYFLKAHEATTMLDLNRSRSSMIPCFFTVLPFNIIALNGLEAMYLNSIRSQKWWNCSISFSLPPVFYTATITFEQLDGVMMGSLVSPIVADLSMEFFENVLLDQRPPPPAQASCFRWFVDDTFVVLSQERMFKWDFFF